MEQKPRDIKIPVAVTVFQGEIYQAPKTWTERAYPNLSYFNEVDNGGHFAARGLPQLAAKGRVALACPLSRCVGRSLVGASLLAMEVNDNACGLNERGVWTSIASRLAPTGEFWRP
ncbi:hypothetical protein FBY04_107181 [Pseudomonas sp. SJZ080]|nr:hypothetical protein FBY04_107181 [Pseudomonas sp. SJZ080]